ncbi:armadillo-type protein [Mycena capillaripes]|nr:armadillo-type protein [Mycena capillaripes]
MMASFIMQSDLIEELLYLSDAQIRRHTCKILGILAAFDDSTPWCLETCTRLVALLSDEDREVHESAFQAFVRISESPDGVQAVLDTRIWEFFPERQNSSNSTIYQLAHHILENLIAHEVASLKTEGSRSFYFLFVFSKPCALRCLDSDTDRRRGAIYALSQMSYWSEGAEAAAETGVLEYLANLLNSAHAETRRWTCETLGNMAFHGSMSSVQMGVELCTQIISLLSDDDKHVRDCAILTLSKINRSPKGMGAVAWHPAILKHLTVHLTSPEARIRRFTCSILGDLAVYQSASLAILSFEPCTRVMGLLRDSDSEVRRSAVYALSKLNRWRGVTRAVEAEAVKRIPALLEYSNPDIQSLTCEFLGNLAIHKSSAVAALRTDLCTQTVSLLSGSSGVREQALYAIATLSYSCEGAQVVQRTRIWEYFLELLHSSDPRIRGFTCRILGNLAIYESASLTLMKPYVAGMVSLLRDGAVEVQRCAMYALSKMTYWPHAAQAVTKVMALEYVLDLLRSSDAQTRRWACETLGNLVSNHLTSPAQLGAKPCAQMVALLSDKNKHVRHGAILALSKISRSRKGAHTVGATKILKYCPKLLHYQNSRSLICETLENLAFYKTLPNLGEVLRRRLTLLLSEGNSDIRESAMFALLS